MSNGHPGFIDEVYKCCSINLSPNTIGQAAMSAFFNPPKPGDPSYPLYHKEKSAELASLRRRAHMVTDAFNSMEGVTCKFTEGERCVCACLPGWLASSASKHVP